MIEYLTFSAFSDKELIQPIKNEKGLPISYMLMLNPDSLDFKQNFDHQTPNSLSFSIIIDCTGIIDPRRTNLVEEIKCFESILYSYNGKIQGPNFVEIKWGNHFKFDGKITNMDISYTLFKPDGTPLRAKISMKFEQQIN